MMQNSKYTVLMSVYYKEKPEYLSLSIESMLNQTVKPDEFIIVKDGPLTTELDEVINNFVTAYPKTFNIIVNETNLGLGPALAKGIENSKNELIARMDSDDYVVSTRCERQLEKFREDPKLGMVGSYEAEFVDDIDNVISIHNQCALRLSCYECPYATTERKTDMTIGDFWHIEETIPDFYDEKGNSIFLIHTDRGEQLFETVKVKLEYRLSDTKQCWQANLEAPTKRSEQRDEFWNDYQRKGVDFVMKKYGTTPLKTKIKNKLVKLISIGGGKP